MKKQQAELRKQHRLLIQKKVDEILLEVMPSLRSIAASHSNNYSNDRKYGGVFYNHYLGRKS
jgi:hypothetical protein